MDEKSHKSSSREEKNSVVISTQEVPAVQGCLMSLPSLKWQFCYKNKVQKARNPLPTAGGLKLDDLGGPFQPGHSMTGLGAQVEPQFFHPTFTVITIKTKSSLLFFLPPLCTSQGPFFVAIKLRFSVHWQEICLKVK